MAVPPQKVVPHHSSSEPVEFRKALGLFDSIMIVAGIMVGSGIFIVSAEITRQVGSAGWLLGRLDHHWRAHRGPPRLAMANSPP